MNWRRFSGKKIDDIEKTIVEDIEKYTNDYELQFIVSCDSQVKKPIVVFTTAIIMLRFGHGGLAYYRNEQTPYNKMQPRRRLFQETEKSVTVALWLDEILLPYNLEVLEIHSDLNPSKKFLSNEVVAECCGYIQGMGFVGKARIKPYAWGASSVANKKSK